MAEPRFDAGERVQVRVTNPTGHTRLPGYVRGREGAIESVRAPQPLPDETVANAAKGDPAVVYSVIFEMAELWGEDAEAGSELVMELWEAYLERAGETARPREDAQ